MKFQEWAPTFLVKEYENRLLNPSSKRPDGTRDPEKYVFDFVKRQGPMTAKNLEILFQRTYRRGMGALPEEERTELLKMLITDFRMKSAWRTLEKWIVKESELYDYFRVCERALACWRGEQKLTISEQEALYMDISETVIKLWSLMREASKFDGYDVKQLLSDDEIKDLLEGLESPYKDDIRRNSIGFLYVTENIPTIGDIFGDIFIKARKYWGEKSSIKRPKGRNAQVNYFIRYVSNYLQGRYNRPLNRAVAITTSVIFDHVDIDADHVRQIVKS